jgi:hypothetical protein
MEERKMTFVGGQGGTQGAHHGDPLLMPGVARKEAQSTLQVAHQDSMKHDEGFRPLDLKSNHDI